MNTTGKATVRKLEEILQTPQSLPDASWQLRVIQSGDCMSYFAWNQKSREGIIVDPKREDWSHYSDIIKELRGIRWLMVIDTHTHADHVSAAVDLAKELGVPVVMHEAAPSRRVHLRVSCATTVPAEAGGIHLLPTPGHTADSLTAFWGPYLFGGDTLLYGDTGRDDLPTGSPEAHFESLEKIKSVARSHFIVLPGHDHKGGRASDWSEQLKVNASLTQDRQTFVAEAGAFRTSPPQLFKESLFENFK